MDYKDYNYVQVYHFYYPVDILQSLFMFFSLLILKYIFTFFFFLSFSLFFDKFNYFAGINCHYVFINFNLSFNKRSLSYRPLDTFSRVFHGNLTPNMFKTDENLNL